MLGEFVNDYQVVCTDVFAMPQTATTVSVESVDPLFQQKMMDMLKQTGRHEYVIGWYHSHPGFGCWLSFVDVKTQISFEKMHHRSVAVVIDPVQSVKGRVVMDCFRSIDTQHTASGAEPRSTTSNAGMMRKHEPVAKLRGLNKLFYSMLVKSSSVDQHEIAMLSRL